MKLIPLTDDEIKDIKCKVWEPLRRNQDYINDYAKLEKKSFLDLDAVIAFCAKWKLPYHVDPDLEFDKLYGPLKGETKDKAKRRIENLFFDWYIPESDNAAFVDPEEWIIEGKYLKVYINLEKSKNQIKGEIKKILDEWLKKAETFYNLNKESTSRLNETAWMSCFQVYDMVERLLLPYPKIAIKLGKPVNTIHKQYKRAWLSIYPEEKYPTKRYRKKEIGIETIPCTTCTDRVCEKTGKLCPEVEKFVNQDSVKKDYYLPLEKIENQYRSQRISRRKSLDKQFE